jgi:hypothetical protein
MDIYSGTTVNCLPRVKIEFGLLQQKKCVCNYKTFVLSEKQAVFIVPTRMISFSSFTPHPHLAPVKRVEI